MSRYADAVQRPYRQLSRTEKCCLLPLAATLGVLAWCGALGCFQVPPQYVRTIDDPPNIEPPLQIALTQRLDRLIPGMSPEEVAQIVRTRVEPRWAIKPIIGPLLEREISVGGVVAYQIQRSRKIGHERHEIETLWFYFKDDALIRWGPPGDWPVVEKSAATEAAPVAPASDANAPANPLK